MKASPKRSRRRGDELGISGRLENVQLEDLLPPQEPLLNVFTFGWMEDGRLGYEADDSSYIQSVPRPMASLRAHVPKMKGPPVSGKKDSAAEEKRAKEFAEKEAAAKAIEDDEVDAAPKMEERYVVKGIAAGSRHTLMYMANVYPESEEEMKKVKEELTEKTKNKGEEKKKTKDRFADDTRRKAAA